MPAKSTPSLQTKHNTALAELESYRLLVESVEDYAIFHLDTEGNILTWNRGAERNKGYKKTEIIGKHFSIFYMQHDKDARKPERELEIAKRAGRVEDEDWRVRKDGSRFWANVVITALFNDSGELVGFAKVTRDLTERKQHEDDLRKANTLLRRQQRELQILNDSKDEFISLASHQLRTPATAIKQLLGLLLEGLQGELVPEQLPLIEKAYNTNDRQISIVNSLLKVAQLDSGKVVLSKSAVNAADMLREITDEYADNIASRGQTLEYKPESEVLCIDGDPRYLRMAFENLLDNASKYTHDGGKISVEVRQKGADTVVSFTDTGVGIPAEDMPELFQKFKRIPNDLSQKVAGSGLGLYWVNEVVKLHGGSISVDSRPAHGTTFTVCLPGATSDA